MKQFKKSFSLFVLFILSTGFLYSQVINHWRGPDRDGIYHETNLLTSWADGQPEMVWAYEELGRGFTSPAVENNLIYISGIDGDIGYLHVLNRNGELLKKIAYGEEVSSRTGYPGTRSSPTVADNLVYIVSGFGKLVCINTDTEEIEWSVNILDDFDGENIRWSFTESLIIKDDKVYVSPGGRKYNIIALNRFNGELVWSNPGKGNTSAYCSPLIINHNGRNLLVQMMNSNTFGIDPDTGETIWVFPYKNRLGIHPNTPIYYEGDLFIFSGYGKGGKRLNLSDDGTEVEEVWYNETIDNQIGGAVILDGRVYLSGHNNRSWYCVDWESGEILYETTDIGKGTIIAADNMLYLYSDRGELALMKPLDDRFKLVGEKEISLGSKQHWAHLVINDGILFVRRGEALMAFDISAN